MTPALFVLLLAIPLAATAQIYQTTDENGNVVFTDQPPAGGVPRGEPQASSSWALTNVFCGAHDLTVSLLDVKGATLATSSPIRVYVMRPSINTRNRN